MIEGIVGKGEKGDLAIDDIVITSGSCDSLEYTEERTEEYSRESTADKSSPDSSESTDP